MSFGLHYGIRKLRKNWHQLHMTKLAEGRHLATTLDMAKIKQDPSSCLKLDGFRKGGNHEPLPSHPHLVARSRS